MKRWCRACQASYDEREGGIIHDAEGRSLYWVCQRCTRQAKVSGGGRVWSLEDFLHEGGSAAVDAALDALNRTPKVQT